MHERSSENAKTKTWQQWFGSFGPWVGLYGHERQLWYALDNLVVPNDAAPMFFVCAADDGVVAPQADKLYSAWQSAGKSIEFHVYSKGGHGFGMRKQGLPIDNWIEQFEDWLNIQGFLKR